MFIDRYRFDQIPSAHGGGVYAFYLAGTSMRDPLCIDFEGPLYVGMAGTDLNARNHIFHENSSFSTLRRSLGAMLKEELKLRAKARGAGRSQRDYTHYCFIGDGEKSLTEWMSQHLLYSYKELIDDIRSTESQLIANLKPPLNLTKWNNPQKKMLMDLRKVCRDEAARGSDSLETWAKLLERKITADSSALLRNDKQKWYRLSYGMMCC